MSAAGEKILKIVSSNMQKQKKVGHRRRIFFEIWYFWNPGVCISFMRIQRPPLEKLGGLTWKGAPLISKFSKTPLHFWDPKVQPLPFQKGGGVELCTWPQQGSHKIKS